MKSDGIKRRLRQDSQQSVDTSPLPSAPARSLLLLWRRMEDKRLIARLHPPPNLFWIAPTQRCQQQTALSGSLAQLFGQSPSLWSTVEASQQPWDGWRWNVQNADDICSSCRKLKRRSFDIEAMRKQREGGPASHCCQLGREGSGFSLPRFFNCKTMQSVLSSRYVSLFMMPVWSSSTSLWDTRWLFLPDGNASF